MTCATQPCPNFQKRMAAEKKAGELRTLLERERNESARLRARLARVGNHELEPPAVDTRPLCGERAFAGRCEGPVFQDGKCAAHWADAAGVSP
jgi:hypothetical protein